LHLYHFLATFFLGVGHWLFWTLEIPTCNCTSSYIVFWNFYLSSLLAMDCF
jgi:hypothetical protein